MATASSTDLGSTWPSRFEAIQLPTKPEPFWWLMLDHPDWDYRRQMAQFVGQCKHYGVEWRLRLDPDYRVRATVVRYTDSLSLLDETARADRHHLVRATALAHQKCPLSAFLYALRNPRTNLIELKAIAGNPNAARSVLHDLAGRGLSALSTPLATNPSFHFDDFETLWYSVPTNAVARHLLQRQSVPSKLLRVWAKSDNRDIRWAVASHPRCPHDIRELLSSDLDMRIRYTIASFVHIPPEILMKLASDPHRKVRRIVAQHLRSQPLQLDQLASDPDVKVRIAVANNPNSAPATLMALAESGPVAVRRLVARHAQCPPETLVRLAHCRSEVILQEVARHPNSPADAFPLIMGAPHSRVRRLAAQHPNCPDHLRAIHILANSR